MRPILLVPSDPRKLRRAIAVRLALVAVSVATVAGTAAYLKGRSDVDGHVLALALEQSRSLVRHLGFLTEANPAVYERLRLAVTEHVREEHVRSGRFVAMEIYGPDRRIVLEAADPLHQDVHDEIEMAFHTSRLSDEPSSRHVSIGRATYLQVFAPLTEGGRTTAYFDGIYEVDPATLARMDRGVLELVLAVVGAIFVTALALYPVILRLQGNVLGVSTELAQANMALLAALGSAVAKRDRDTNAHNYRVTIYAVRLGVAVGLSRDQIRALVKGAFLHDVGKIAVADAILRKPGPLTADEKTAMQAHVAHGLEIVGNASWLDDALDVVRFHHEKVDGTGYPFALKGDQIPVVARVFAIVDVFDALTTRRPYKEPAPLEATLASLERMRGTSFDPVLLDAFLAIAPGLHRQFCDRPEEDLARSLDACVVDYFGVGASTSRPLGVAAAAAERPEPATAVR
jgi:HD-GYP domain-containing protein (c-di-GMP phosphodiesterase class II)